MPYINEVLDNNRAQLEDARRRKAVAAASASRFLFEPDKVFESLSRRIVGQPEPLAAVHDMLHILKADFGVADRPLSVMLFVGSTGVGKTETVRVLAESISGNVDALCRIDMNTLAQEHYAAALTGAPPGYVGSKEHHTLFDFDKVEGSFSRPGIVLLDELEKANDAVIRALLNVCDSGILTLSAGTKSVNFRNSLIFMTSNVGVRELAAYRKKYASGWRRFFNLKPSKKAEQSILQTALEKRFDPEFINRIDRVVYFAELDAQWLRALLELELAQLNKRLAKRDVVLQLDSSAEQHLIAAHDARYGARNIKRRFRRELEPALARALNARPEATVFIGSYNKQTLEVHPVPATETQLSPE